MQTRSVLPPVVLLLPWLAGAAHARPFSLPPETRQLLVVTSEGWKAHDATLQRWARGDTARWVRVGDAITVVLGGSGMGWGAGLDDTRARSAHDPQKRESDRRAPAGVFGLDDAFGAAPADTRLPYRVANDDLICVDDPEAVSYNRILDRALAGKYATAESMRRNDGQYALGIVVRHNLDPILPGAGSCVFIHVWGRPGEPTIGCTAMAEPSLRTVLAWLDPHEHPLLVQLPRSVYASRRAAWRLP